jgi:hypothetical protein
VHNPSHTYASAGTYTVTLTATNAAGSSAPATGTITVATAPTGGTGIAFRSSSSTSVTTATAAVTVGRPAGTTTGDVLIAQITADAAPNVSVVPAGWTAITSPLAASTGARVFTYYHVVGTAAEPTSYSWTLSSAVKWGAGITAFSGVNTTNPFDTVAATASNTTYSSTTVSVPSVTTVTAGAVLVGGVGLDSGATAITPATGWTEGWEATGGQEAELAWRPVPTAGATGTSTWTLSKATAWVGWVRALRPAA